VLNKYALEGTPEEVVEQPKLDEKGEVIVK
jgi:hypothetical protein